MHVLTLQIRRLQAVSNLQEMDLEEYLEVLGLSSFVGELRGKLGLSSMGDIRFASDEELMSCGVPKTAIPTLRGQDLVDYGSDYDGVQRQSQSKSQSKGGEAAGGKQPAQAARVIRIAGASGHRAVKINGTYKQQGMHNDRALYHKLQPDDDDVWLRLDQLDTWTVGSTEDKDADNSNGGWAFCAERSISDPTDGTQWKVATMTNPDGITEWEVQSLLVQQVKGGEGGQGTGEEDWDGDVGACSSWV